MIKFASPLTVVLLVATSPQAWAEANSSADLRYCLDLKSNEEIAKCAGEISPGAKSKPYPKERVEEILEKERTRAPVSPGEPTDMPGPANDKPGQNLLPEETQGSSN